MQNVLEETAHDSLESEDAVKITVEPLRNEENATGILQVCIVGTTHCKEFDVSS